MFRSYDHLQGGNTSEFNILTVSIIVYYFIQNNCYMFRSYDHLKAEIHTLEINILTISIVVYYFIQDNRYVSVV
jgi:hypothetical protein